MFHQNSLQMKSTKGILFIVSILAASPFFYSCSSNKNIVFFNNTYKRYEVKETQPSLSHGESATNHGERPAKSENSAGRKEHSRAEAPINNTVSNNTPEINAWSKNLSEDPIQNKKLNKEEKKAIKKQIREAVKTNKKSETNINKLLLVIIAILLPPVAVALVDGIGGPFLLSILLTLLFYIPGLIYALFRIFRKQ